MDGPVRLDDPDLCVYRNSGRPLLSSTKIYQSDKNQQSLNVRQERLIKTYRKQRTIFCAVLPDTGKLSHFGEILTVAEEILKQIWGNFQVFGKISGKFCSLNLITLFVTDLLAKSCTTLAQDYFLM